MYLYKKKVEIAKNVIENTKQPHEFLVRSIQSKETQLKKQQVTIEMMQNKIDELSTEREKLLRKQNDMTTDIEKLIRHNDELFSIRDDLKKSGMLLNKRYLNSNTVSGSNSRSNMDALSANQNQPKPLMFVS